MLDLGTDWDFELSASEWHELRSGGWIEESRDFKSARPRRGVVAWVRGGDLYLLSLARLRTVGAAWARAWMYSIGVISARYVGETWRERCERIVWEREVEALWEAAIWKSGRDGRGKNSESFMTPEQKAEILRALRPEAA